MIFIFTATLFCFFIKQLNMMVIIKRVSLLAMEPCSRTFPVWPDGGAVEPRYCRWTSSKALLQVTIIPKKPTKTYTNKTVGHNNEE